MENERRAMKRDVDLLPSDLYASFIDNNYTEESLDHESLLLNVLSLVSTLGDIAPYFSSRFHSQDDDIDHYQGYDIVSWAFKSITQVSPSMINGNIGDGTKHEEDFLLYEWYMAFRYIHDLLQHIPPFELHFLASQSILLSEGLTISHRILCFLLCTHSLQQCPLSLKKRWKRWQSLVCETVRIFQDSIHILDGNDGKIDSGMPSVSLLIRHIVPSCIHVIDQLPFENPYHVAIFSGLMGTSSNLLETIVGRCDDELFKGTKDADSATFRFRESLCTTYDSIQSIISSFDRFGSFSENALWIETMRQPCDKVVNRNKDVDFWMHRDSLSWWAHHRRSHEPEERIADMDTSFHKTGLGLLAMKAFQERPMVYHPNYIWTIWFPHVVVLFSKSVDFPSLLQNWPSRFLESLIEIVPEESLLLERTIFGISDALFEIFHLLSNQLMSRIQNTRDIEEGKSHLEANSSVDEDANFKMRSQRTVGLIKALLTRFTPASQVKIVEQVIQSCSNPGLQARFLDLLRPLILIPDIETEKLLWSLLMSIVDDLFKNYWDQKEQILINIDLLINRDVEISVGAITMIQMWSLVDEKEFFDDRKAIAENLRGFRFALQKLLCRWSEDTSVAPKLHYRLFLLDIGLQNTTESLAL